jgi:hypothetical protein
MSLVKLADLLNKIVALLSILRLAIYRFAVLGRIGGTTVTAGGVVGTLIA